MELEELNKKETLHERNRRTDGHYQPPDKLVVAARMFMGASMCLDRMNPFDYVYRSLNVKLEVLGTGKPESQ